MARSYRAPNKRIIMRKGNGRFRKTTMADFGVGGVCQNCNHLLVRHYDGDESDPFVDPRKFRYRCFACEPRNAEEQIRFDTKLQDEKERNQSFFKKLAEDLYE